MAMRQSIHPVYLDHAAMGLRSAATVAAVSRFTRNLVSPDLTGTQRSLELFEAVERARRHARSIAQRGFFVCAAGREHEPRPRFSCHFAAAG